MAPISKKKPLTRWQIVLLAIVVLAALWLASQFIPTQSDTHLSAPSGNYFTAPESAALPAINPLAALREFVAPDSFAVVNDNREALTIPTAEAPSGSGGGEGDTTVTPQTERLIVRAGVLTLVVDDPRSARIQVEAMIGEMAGDGAFVIASTEQASGNDKPPTVAMAVRVPVARFDETMNRIAELAKDVLIRSATAQDVTEEYVDLQAKVQSLEVARDRLLQIMAEAKTTKDLLEIEKQLTQRNAEIDSMKARLQYLEQTASLSSIQIEFRPSIASQTVIPGWHPDDTVRKSFERLVQRFQNTVDWWIAFAIADLPWLLLYGVIIVVAARFGLRWWRSRAPTKSVPADDAETQAKV